jgi:hypothetical protein
MPNANFDDLLSTTLNNHMPKLVDNVFSARPLFHFLNESGNIRKVGGGAKIVIPIIHGENTNTATYAGAGTLGIAEQDGITAAEYDWKQIATSVVITGIDEAKNSGPEQAIDLLEAKIMQAEESVTELLDELLIKGVPGTSTIGSGTAANEWFGLEALVTRHVNDTVVGGINPTTDAFWASYRDTTTEALTISDMTTAYNTTAVGADQPTMVLTTQALYEKYESLLQPAQRFTDSSTADAGFQNLLFKGAPVCYDTYVPAGYMYFLNTKYLRLVGHKDTWFKTTPFVRTNDIDARFAQILCYGNFTVSNRKRQGVLTGKS